MIRCSQQVRLLRQTQDPGGCESLFFLCNPAQPVSRFLVLQAAWRGAWQRRQAGHRLWEVRKRLALAALEGARNPQKRLGARTLAAVRDLLNARYLSDVSHNNFKACGAPIPGTPLSPSRLFHFFPSINWIPSINWRPHHTQRRSLPSNWHLRRAFRTMKLAFDPLFDHWFSGSDPTNCDP